MADALTPDSGNEPEDWSDSESVDDIDPSGENLVVDPGHTRDYSHDDPEAEELEAATAEEISRDASDDDDLDIDDEEQLDEAEAAAAMAPSSRPVRKGRPTGVAPAKKSTATPSRRASQRIAAREQRTSPVQFVGEAVAELRKVVWPTGTQLQQYFVVVLVFVFFIIAFVSLLDAGFGWALLKALG